MSDDDNVRLGTLFEEYEQNSKITILDAGKHTLEVTSCTARNKGVCPVYKILEGPNVGKRAMAGGIYPGDSEGGRQAFFRKLEKFGLTKQFFSLNPTLSDVAKALVGRVVKLDVTIGEWNGEPRNDLAFGIELVSSPDLPAVGGVPSIPAPASAPALVSTPGLPGAPQVVQEQAVSEEAPF